MKGPIEAKPSASIVPRILGKKDAAATRQIDGEDF